MINGFLLIEVHNATETKSPKHQVMGTILVPGADRLSGCGLQH